MMLRMQEFFKRILLLRYTGSAEYNIYVKRVQGHWRRCAVCRTGASFLIFCCADLIFRQAKVTEILDKYQLWIVSLMP